MRRSDGCLLDASAHLCGALSGSRSTTHRMNLRNTLFGSQSKSTSCSLRIRQQSTCHTEKLPRSRCPVFDLAIRRLHNPTPQMRGHTVPDWMKGEGRKKRTHEHCAIRGNRFHVQGMPARESRRSSVRRANPNRRMGAAEGWRAKAETLRASIRKISMPGTKQGGNYGGNYG